MNEPKCIHKDDPKSCSQCRIEALDTPELLAEVAAYEINLRKNGFVPSGWWVELAHRLQKVSP